MVLASAISTGDGWHALLLHGASGFDPFQKYRERKHGSLEDAGVTHEVTMLSMELKGRDLMWFGGKEKLAPGGGNWLSGGIEDMARSAASEEKV